MSQTLLIAVGIPLMLIAGLLPIALFIAKITSRREAIPQELKNQFGLGALPDDSLEVGERFSWRQLFFQSLVACVLVRLVPSLVHSFLVLGLAVLVLALSGFGFWKATTYFMLARRRAELPASLVRYARYAFVALILSSSTGLLFGGTILAWWMREMVGSPQA